MEDILTIKDLRKKVYGKFLEEYKDNCDTWLFMKEMFIRIETAHRFATECQGNPRQALEQIAEILNGTAITH